MGKRWRLFFTGACFVLYGFIALSGSLVALPLIYFFSGNYKARQQRARGLISASFRILMKSITTSPLRLGSIEIEGRQWLDQCEGKLLVANHPTYLDIVALIGLLPRASCVVKQSMWRSPLYRYFAHAAGYISNRNGVDLVAAGTRAIGQGQAVVLFPEGTRSQAGKPLRFFRSAAHIAIHSHCEVVPVIIRCQPLVLGRGQAWYRIADRPWHLSIKISPPRSIHHLGYHHDQPKGVAARRVTQSLENFFNEQLEP